MLMLVGDFLLFLLSSVSHTQTYMHATRRVMLMLVGDSFYNACRDNFSQLVDNYNNQASFNRYNIPKVKKQTQTHTHTCTEGERGDNFLQLVDNYNNQASFNRYNIPKVNRH
jgi:ABC-type nickel/cobalt efflux system permease component RcnA